MTLAELAAAGKLTSRDIDVILVALGFLSYDSVDRYLTERVDHVVADPSTLDDDVAGVAAAVHEVVDRICGCQYQDGGSTRIADIDGLDVRLEVEGACRHCPQIGYTMGIVERAIRFRAPTARSITFEGTRFEEGRVRPENSQVTMGMLMRHTGLRFEDLDELLARRSPIDDRDIERLAHRCYFRKMGK